MTDIDDWAKELVTREYNHFLEDREKLEKEMIEAEEIQAENEKIIKRLTGAYKRLFKTKDGVEVMADLESFCNLYKTSVCESSPNPDQTMFAEGKRRVLLRILSFIRKEEDE